MLGSVRLFPLYWIHRNLDFGHYFVCNIWYYNIVNKVYGIKNTKFIVTTLIMKQVQKQVNCCVLTIFKTPMYGCKLMTITGWVINTKLLMQAVDVLIGAWSYLRRFTPRVGNTEQLYFTSLFFKYCLIVYRG